MARPSRFGVVSMRRPRGAWRPVVPRCADESGCAREERGPDGARVPYAAGAWTGRGAPSTVRAAVRGRRPVPPAPLPLDRNGDRLPGRGVQESKAAGTAVRRTGPGAELRPAGGARPDERATPSRPNRPPEDAWPERLRESACRSRARACVPPERCGGGRDVYGAGDGQRSGQRPRSHRCAGIRLHTGARPLHPGTGARPPASAHRTTARHARPAGRARNPFDGAPRPVMGWPP